MQIKESRKNDVCVTELYTVVQISALIHVLNTGICEGILLILEKNILRLGTEMNEAGG